MASIKEKNFKRARKKRRNRKKLFGTAERPRLSVFRSAKSIYAQLIDDANQKTLTGVSSVTKELRAAVGKAKDRKEVARIVGESIAEKAKSLKVKAVVFDRGGYLYHGRVKALGDAARGKGLIF